MSDDSRKSLWAQRAGQGSDDEAPPRRWFLHDGARSQTTEVRSRLGSIRRGRAASPTTATQMAAESDWRQIRDSPSDDDDDGSDGGSTDAVAFRSRSGRPTVTSLKGSTASRPKAAAEEEDRADVVHHTEGQFLAGEESWSPMLVRESGDQFNSMMRRGLMLSDTISKEETWLGHLAIRHPRQVRTCCEHEQPTSARGCRALQVSKLGTLRNGRSPPHETRSAFSVDLQVRPRSGTKVRVDE